MTEYWVSQGNKWCDFCKIYISNNQSSIRTHEQGTRHKDAVALRVTTIRKENASKDKELKENARALEQIEAKAERSYQKDLAAVQQVRKTNTHVVGSHEVSTASGEEWEYDKSSGYYYNQDNGFYFDPNSGFYYSDSLGKWVTQEEAFASQGSSGQKREPLIKPVFAKHLGSTANTSTTAKDKSGSSSVVVPGSANPMRSVKGAPSSISVSKRKRVDEKPKPKVVSKEEAAALKAREAAKKRMEEREKPLLGLYRS